MLDHILGGPLNLGVSPGALLSDAKAFGTIDRDPNAMMIESMPRIETAEPATDMAAE